MSDTKIDDYYRQKLSKEQYAILRQGQTEAPFSSALLNNKKAGYYLCAACNQTLFKSEHKFDSQSGWPSFYQPALPFVISEKEDLSHFMKRTEVVCQKCKSHLGHVFDDAPQTPTNLRYCINGAALKFKACSLKK